MKKELGKRLVSIMASAAMLFSAASGSFTSGENPFVMNKIYAEDNIVLAAPANLRWKEDSAATAEWDSVDGANYYDVIVIVYNDDNVLGQIQTGTGDTEIDLQMEINSIDAVSQFDSVEVTCKVRAVYQSENNEFSEFSDETEKKRYSPGKIFLNTPKNIFLEDNLIAKWDAVENCDNYVFNVHIEANGEILSTSIATLYSHDINNCNGVVSVDVSSYVNDLFKSYYNENYTNCFVLFDVQACSEKDSYFNSCVSDYSNKVYYSPNFQKLDTPKNVRLSEDGIVEWELVENAVGYTIMVHMGDKGETGGHGWCIDINEIDCSNGIAKYDYSSYINDVYRENALEIQKDEWWTAVSIYAHADNDSEFVNGDLSEPSNYINYKTNLKQFDTPEIIGLNSDYEAEWYVLDDANYYQVFVYVGNDENLWSYRNYSYIVEKTDENCQNGVMKYKIKEEQLMHSYNEIAHYLSGDCWVKFQVRAWAPYDDGSYIGSFRSMYSNSVLYDFNKKIDSIHLSPVSPILYLNHSINLGKTIEPIDAYYTTIDWTSSNPEIVSVDSMGKITGISVGSADITAKIGDAEDTVTVTVYEISSNIENPEDVNNVTDTAGSIIDDIVNNDEPNLDNTDIPEDKIEDIRQEIQDAVENGNTFHTDIKAIQETFDTYKNNWGQVQKAANDLNAQFAGAYNIEVEMYHKDKKDEEHHIGNITELDNEITFTFDLPTGATDKAKRYVLVRIHKNSDGAIEYSPVDVIINDDGTFTAKSNKFSDFVLLVSDLENGSNIEDNHIYNNYGYCKDCGNIQNGTDAFVSAKAVVGGQIAMNFKVALSDEAAADSEAKMIFSLESGKVISIPLSQATLVDPAKSIYEFALTLTSTQMDEKITAKMQYSDAVTYNKNTQESVLADYSVNKYLDSIQNQEEGKDNPNTKLISVIKAMRTYGAYIDIYSGDNISDFTPEDLSNREVSVDNIYSAVVEGTVDGVSAKAASLTVGSLIDINVKFNVTGNIEDYTFTVDGAVVQPVLADGVYCVKAAEISPLNYSKMYNVSVTDGQNTISVKYSALSYVKNKLNDTDQNLINVCKAMYMYNEAVNAYIN